MVFCIFYQVNLTGLGFLNRTCAEIRFELYKKMQNNHYLLLKKLKNTESVQLWTIWTRRWSFGFQELLSEIEKNAAETCIVGCWRN